MMKLVQPPKSINNKQKEEEEEESRGHTHSNGFGDSPPLQNVGILYQSMCGKPLALTVIPYKTTTTIISKTI